MPNFNIHSEILFKDSMKSFKAKNKKRKKLCQVSNILALDKVSLPSVLSTTLGKD